MNDANRSSVGHYRWVICALLFFATTINYVDRAVFGVLEPELDKDHRLDAPRNSATSTPRSSSPTPSASSSPAG